MKANDLLPDELNSKDFGGQIVRKGTVGAFIINHRVAINPEVSSEDRAAALEDMVDAIPALRALGIFEVFELRDPAIRAFVAEKLAG